MGGADAGGLTRSAEPLPRRAGGAGPASCLFCSATTIRAYSSLTWDDIPTVQHVGRGASIKRLRVGCDKPGVANKQPWERVPRAAHRNTLNGRTPATATNDRPCSVPRVPSLDSTPDAAQHTEPPTGRSCYRSGDSRGKREHTPSVGPRCAPPTPTATRLALNAHVVHGVALAVSEGGNEELVPERGHVRAIVQQTHARVRPFFYRLRSAPGAGVCRRVQGRGRGRWREGAQVTGHDPEESERSP